MPISKAEYVQLRKCMARTTSDSDAEALASIRRANVLLAIHSLTWDNVFDRVVKVIDGFVDVPVFMNNTGEALPQGSSHRATYRRDDHEDWDRLFDDAMADASGEFLGVLESIHRRWEERGTMSERQRQVVREAAERYAARHPGGRVR